jgi:hypothetical protein
MKASFAQQLIPYLELLAGITGIICYFNDKRSLWFKVAVALVLLFCFELLGEWLGTHDLRKANSMMFKWFVIPLLLFGIYHLVFYSINKGSTKKTVVFVYAFFLCLVVFENIFFNTMHKYQISLSISAGCISILYFSLHYFFDLVKTDAVLNFKTSMTFWFCCGLLIFYLGCFPYLSFFNSLNISKDKTIFNFYRWIFICLNYVMYLLFTIGFICSRPKRSPSLL